MLRGQRARHRFEDPFDLWRAVSEAFLPESVARVLEHLNEGDEQAPLRTFGDEWIEAREEES